MDIYLKILDKLNQGKMEQPFTQNVFQVMKVYFVKPVNPDISSKITHIQAVYHAKINLIFQNMWVGQWTTHYVIMNVVHFLKAQRQM